MPQVPGDPTAVVWSLEELLGGRTLESVLGHRIEGDVTLSTEPYHFGSPATGGLVRVYGDGWSAFVKVLHHLRHWPLLPTLPPEAAAEMLDEFPWSEEVELWNPMRMSRMPEGLRVPHLYDVVDLGDDRVAVWTELVDALGEDWALEDFDRAGRLLGHYNARLADAAVVDACPLPADFAMEKWAAVGLLRGLGPLQDDALWRHPWLAPHFLLRARMLDAAGRVRDVLDRLRPLPHGMPHGDASPQNLLRSRESGELVMIDISFQAPSPLGSDLAQLVVGLAHAGVLAADQLPDVERTVLDAYAEGVVDCGVELNETDLRTSYAGTLLLRSGLTSLPYEWLDDPAQEDAFASRVELTRFIMDSADRLL